MHRSVAPPPLLSSAAAVYAQLRKRILLFPARGLGSAVPFLLLAVRPQMSFLPLFARYLWITLLLPLCPQDRYV